MGYAWTGSMPWTRRGSPKTCENQRTHACGAGPLITLMIAAKKLGADRGKVLHYANSGDVTGDRSGVVGYAAAAIYRSTEHGDAEKL